MLTSVLNYDLEHFKTNQEIGPGKYNTILKSKKNFHVSGGSSMFLSKVRRTQFGSKSQPKTKIKKGSKSTKGVVRFNQSQNESDPNLFTSFNRELEGKFSL